MLSGTASRSPHTLDFSSGSHPESKSANILIPFLKGKKGKKERVLEHRAGLALDLEFRKSCPVPYFWIRLPLIATESPSIGRSETPTLCFAWAARQEGLSFRLQFTLHAGGQDSLFWFVVSGWRLRLAVSSFSLVLDTAR